MEAAVKQSLSGSGPGQRRPRERDLRYRVAAIHFPASRISPLSQAARGNVLSGKLRLPLTGLPCTAPAEVEAGASRDSVPKRSLGTSPSISFPRIANGVFHLAHGAFQADED